MIFSLHELLRHEHNGLIFNDHKELAEQLQVCLCCNYCYKPLPFQTLYQGYRKQFRSDKADQRGGVAAPLVRMRRLQLLLVMVITVITRKTITRYPCLKGPGNEANTTAGSSIYR